MMNVNEKKMFAVYRLNDGSVFTADADDHSDTFWQDQLNEFERRQRGRQLSNVKSEPIDVKSLDVKSIQSLDDFKSIQSYALRCKDRCPSRDDVHRQNVEKKFVVLRVTGSVARIAAAYTPSHHEHHCQ